MPSSRIPSPARSQGAKTTPRRYKPRASRSVGSPARSTSAVKLTTLIQMDSMVLSPMPSRRSVLTDTTDIDIPRRKSWWKKLDENSRGIMEVLNNKEPAEAKNAIEDDIEIDVLSQENRNYALDVPESSDGESISSIVIPQRRLFTQKENKPHKKFAQIIDNRESLAILHKTQGDEDKTLHAGRKNLFNQGTKQRNKPLFPTALLNISANKTIDNRAKDMAATDAKDKGKSLFGNRPGVKRKNMFADFIVSDSEDDIPEIQTKVFEFQKKIEQKRRQSLRSRDRREFQLASPTSSITDVEMDDWRLLPSSTMVDHQLEEGLRSIPNKRARQSTLPEAIACINSESNTTTNKTKQSNKSLQSKSKSRNMSQCKELEVHDSIAQRSDILELETSKENIKSTSKIVSREQSLKQYSLNDTVHRKSRNISLPKTVDEVENANILEDKKSGNRRNYKDDKILKTLSNIGQELHTEEDKDTSYENNDSDKVETEGNMKVLDGAEDPKIRTSITNHSVSQNVNVEKQIQNTSKSQNIIPQSGNEDTVNQEQNKSHNNSRNNQQSKIKNTIMNKNQRDISNLDNEMENEKNLNVNKSHNNSRKNLQSKINNTSVNKEQHDVSNLCNEMENEKVLNVNKSHNKSRENIQSKINNTSINKKQRDVSNLCNEIENEKKLNVDHEVNNDETSSKLNKVGNHEEEEIQVLSNRNRIVESETSKCNSKNIEMNEGNNESIIHGVKDQNEPDIEHNRKSVNEEIDTDKDVLQEDHTETVEKEEQKQYLRDSFQNVSQESVNNSEETIEDVEEDSKGRIEDEDVEEDTEGRIEDEDDDKISSQSEDSEDKHEDEENGYNLEVEIEKSKNDIHKVNDEITEDVPEHYDIQLCDEKRQNEGRNLEVEEYENAQDEIDNVIINCETQNIGTNEVIHKSVNEEANITHDTTGRHRRKRDEREKVPSPELILHKKPSQMESFTIEGRNTSVRKSKSIIKDLTIRPSLAPVRESSCFSNNSRNSSANKSEWDSHRTTRATLRQTFGKDFTPRKSLRALVMEKSAKRRTNFTEKKIEICRLPQANSTELPGSLPLAMDVSDFAQKDIESDHEISRGKSNNAQELHKSNTKVSQEFCVAKNVYPTNQNSSQAKDEADYENHEINKNDKAHEMEILDQEVSGDINHSDDVQNYESDHENELGQSAQDVSRGIDDSDDAHEMDDQDVSRGIDDSDDEHETDECEQEVSQNMDDSDDEHEIDACEQEVSHNMDDSDDEHEIDACEQEVSHNMDNSDDEHEIDACEQEVSNNMDDSDDDMNECDQEMSCDIVASENDNDEIAEQDESQVTDDAIDADVMNQSDDSREINESSQKANEESEIDEPNDVHVMDEFDDAQEMDDSEGGHEILPSGHEESRKKRQTTLEIYLQEVKKRNIERKKQLEDQVMNSLKAPTRDMLNPFKVPAIPKLRRLKAQQIKPKAKPTKPSTIPLNVLPAEVLEDLKYKPPKRYRPTNASWITKRLYKFLETKLEPKYDYKARVRSEKLVETIYNFTKDIRRHATAPVDAVTALKHEMARLEIVKTHFEFYEFFHEYMPREVRVKVVPDVFNKISLPKHGVFSEILR